jgi:hypothetical protein
MVAVDGQRCGRLPELPGLPRLRASRHLARSGYGFAVVFIVGLVRTRRLIEAPSTLRAVLSAGRWPRLASWDRLGRACLLAGAAGVAVGGLDIIWIGVTKVFVPEDLTFMG